MNALVIATHNAGKVREFLDLLAPLNIRALSAGSLGLPEPSETGVTFAENAAIKSTSAAKLSGHYALADDSGLCVTGLGDAPGVYSADWAGPSKDFVPAFERIQRELLAKGITPEGADAYFMCVLALTSPEGKTQMFAGRVDGTLTFPPRGTHGFGYDSIFVPSKHVKTFAQMEADAKHAISHRARATAAFLAYAVSLAKKETL